jgi:vacuolar-type H+-ATPase subunit E/Vma4
MAEEQKAGEEQGATVANTADATGQPQAANGGATFTLTEQELKDRIETSLKERLERERRKSETATAKAREEAEAKALADQQEWQKLAEKHAARIAEQETALADRETVTAERDLYREALQRHVQPQLEKLPDHIKNLLARLNPVEQLDYLTANADQLGGASATIPATPKAGNGALTPQEKRAKAASVRNMF